MRRTSYYDSLIFCKMVQILQVLCLGPKGPNDGAEGYSLPQELEKAREAG